MIKKNHRTTNSNTKDAVLAWVAGWTLIGMGSKENFWFESNILYLKRNLDFTVTHICLKLLNDTLDWFISLYAKFTSNFY